MNEKKTTQKDRKKISRRNLLQSAAASGLATLAGPLGWPEVALARGPFGFWKSASAICTGTANPSSVTLDASNSASGLSGTPTVTITPTGGNVVFVLSGFDSNNQMVSTVSGGGLTWKKEGAFWYASTSQCLTSLTVTAGFYSAPGSWALWIVAYRGVDVAEPVLSGESGAGAVSTGTTSIATDVITTRPNSLVCVAASTYSSVSPPTISPGTGASLDVQVATPTGYSVQAFTQKNALTPTIGTVETITPSWSANDTWSPVTWGYEILPPIASVSVPTDYSIFTADNGSTGSSFYLPYGTPTANTLCLLAVTWRNTTAMGSIYGWDPVASISQSTTVTTQVFRKLSSTMYKENLQISSPGGAKVTAVLITIRAANTSGTNGSGAIDSFITANNSTANPSSSITPTSNCRIFSFLGTANATAPTAGTGFTLKGTKSSSGGGAGTTKATTSVEASNSLTGSATTAAFTLAAVDWTLITVAVK